MASRLETLAQDLQSRFGDKLASVKVAYAEVTIEVAAGDYYQIMRLLRDEPQFRFDQLIDLCGVDYSAYGTGNWAGKRFAAVSHLLSVEKNLRLRVRVFADDEEFPMLDSVVPLWNGANWFEREAFDLYGIVFAGHPDLRRILTDYGFVGHPFRKDFPITGYVEMRYDPEQQRVVYQPVTIEPRENTPRVVREENYGDLA